MVSVRSTCKQWKKWRVYWMHIIRGKKLGLCKTEVWRRS